MRDLTSRYRESREWRCVRISGMKLKPSVDLLARIAAALGFVQGLSWAILSFTAIIVATWEPDQNNSKTYTQQIEQYIFERFLKASEDSGVEFTINAFDFRIFMCIYFVLSVCWIAISLDQFTAVMKRKNRQAICMLLWGGVTTVISLLDLIFFGLLALDYGRHCQDHSCFLATGIVMTIAARGFTLWVLNLVFAFILIKISAKIIKRRNYVRSILESDYNIPRVQIPKSTVSSQAISQHSAATLPADVYVPPTVKKGNAMYY